jgi:hypothetical protein
MARATTARQIANLAAYNTRNNTARATAAAIPLAPLIPSSQTLFPD